MSDKFAELRVRGILKNAGLPAEGALERASSVSNEVWLSATHVVRIAGRPSSFAREQTISRLLSPAVGYPEIVFVGGRVGEELMIQRRLPGRPLAHAWPWLSDDQRARAVGQVCDRLRALHGTAVTTPIPPIESPQLVTAESATTMTLISRRLDDVQKIPGVDPGLVFELRMALDECADSIDTGAKVLTHADLTFENVLWDGERVTALLDFEYAGVRNADVDLDVILRMAAFPSSHVGDEFEQQTTEADYAQLPQWLRTHYVDLFKAPRQRDRMRVYAIGYDLNELSSYHSVGPESTLPAVHPVVRLRRLVAKESYIDRWIRSNERQRLG